MEHNEGNYKKENKDFQELNENEYTAYLNFGIQWRFF